MQKYLETVSSVLEDAKKNDIIPFNPAHRVRKKHIEKEVQHIPQKYEMSKLMWAIQNEPILYRAYYTLAITTGLRRGELCALQWRDITGACELTVRRSRSCASGEIVESDTKSHRERIVTIPLGIWELLMAKYIEHWVADWTMMRKIKLTRANKSILLKALAPYYYQEKALGHNTENPGRLILKIDSLPADKKATFSTEEIRLMRITINRLRNERLGKGQYTDAADDMLLKLF